VARLVHEALLHLLNCCLAYCALRQQQAALAAALRSLAQQDGGPAAAALRGSQQQADTPADEHGGGADGAGTPRPPEGLPWAGRRAELQRRAADASAALARLRRDYANRQRLLLRVLATKAAEAGSHADELRQLLGALDYNRHYERGMG
jgi:hypothetical protein